LFAGLWLIATPWLFSFEDSNAMTVDVLIGTAVAALAAFEVWLTISHRLNGPTDGDIAAEH
jgi:SPW repeat